MESVVVSKTLTLRPETAADAAFVAGLFRADRAAGFAAMGWPEAAVARLLDDQFRLQAAHFDAVYPGLARYVVEERGHAVGRMYVDRAGDGWRLVEIGILPARQGQGLGAAVIRWLARSARAAGAPAVELQVAHDNPRAAALYRRLGFAAIAGLSATHATMRLTLSS